MGGAHPSDPRLAPERHASPPDGAERIVLGVDHVPRRVPRRDGDEDLDGRQHAVTLPTAVEAESFKPTSKSGSGFDEQDLRPLDLRRADVLITDLMPYYVANTTKNPSSGRSMAANLALLEKHTGKRLGIDAQPTPVQLVALGRRTPGNIERLE